MGNIDIEPGGAGGSSIDLANVDADVVPATDSTYDIGTNTKRWQELFIDAITCTDTFEFQYLGVDAFRLTTLVTTPSGATSYGAMQGLLAVIRPTLMSVSATGATDSSDIALETGNTVNGNAGNIEIIPGTASGTGANGAIVIAGDVVPDADGDRNLGTSALAFNAVFSQNVTVVDAGALTLQEAGGSAIVGFLGTISLNQASTGVNTGLFGYNGVGVTNIAIKTNDRAGTATGSILHETGDGSGSASGDITFYTGDTTSSGDSGDIVLVTGTAAGTRGVASIDALNLQLNDTPMIDAVIENGATGSRPTGVLGKMYFDTTLGHPIWFDSTNWVDATGATV